MDARLSLDTLMGHLDHPYTSTDKWSAFRKECKKNRALEMRCIAACEIGELGFESLACYVVGMEDYNTPGLIGGVTAGLIYAWGHVFRHAKKHSENADLRGALGYALSTESACVVSATGVEYLFGLVSKTTPLSPMGLTIRGIGLIPAIPLGLIAMSGLTYFHNREAGRFLAGKDSLGFVHDYFESKLGKKAISFTNNKLKIKATSPLTIVEKRLPKYLRPVAQENDSLYLVNSPVCRYDPHSRGLIMRGVSECFEEAHVLIRPIENIFRHTH